MSLLPSKKKDLLFILSVDTEEEWDWSGELPNDSFDVSNASKIPAFQSFCRRQGIRPTYFVDYAIADDREAIEALRPIVDARECEIGAHLHPWANPPYYGKTGEFESHMVNLPIAQVEKKLDALIDKLKESFDIVPNAFRTGRWGVNGAILELLQRKDIRIDSSMYPLFRNSYFDCERTPLEPYWPDFDEPLDHGLQRDILEVPVTVAFNRGNSTFTRQFFNVIENPAMQPLRLVAAFWHSRLLRKLYLSPEVISGKEMRPLIDVAIKDDLPYVHMFMHSSSLIDNGGGMLNTQDALGKVTHNIEDLLDYAQQRANIQFCTISEAATILDHRAKLTH